MKFVYVLMILFCISSPLFGEYYKYTDKDGIVHFTDNLANVPVEQRTTADRYEEIKTPAGLDRDRAALKQNKQEPSHKQDVENKSKTLSRFQTLNREKKELDNAYESLVKRKQALRKAKSSISTSAESATHQRKVRQLNQAITDYEQRRKAFKKRAGDFNAQND